MSGGSTMLSVACLGLLCVCCGRLSGAFVSGPAPKRGVPGAAVGVAGAGAPTSAEAPSGAQAPGAAFGAAFSAGVLAATGAALRGASLRRGRVAARAVPGQPSLIQVLEQKGLLSTVEKLGLLSTAEKAGVRIDLPERLGLLKFAEEKGLLTLAENVLTDKGTVPKAAAAGLALAAAALAVGTAEVEPDVEFTQGVFAGALGLPALVALGAAVVISGITGGTRRTVDLDVDQSQLVFNQQKGDFETQTQKTPISLLTVLEQRRLLSFLEENRLLSLAATLASTVGITRPLTLTEQQGVLSTLESTKILSTVEGTSSDTFAAALPGAGAAALLVAAFLSLSIEGPAGPLAALVLGLGGVALFVFAAVLGVLQAPKFKGTR